MTEASFLTRLYEALKTAFTENEAIIQSDYSTNISGTRRVIDIVVEHFDWGLYVIEVKPYTLRDIERGRARPKLEQLGIKEFSVYEDPYEQAINLLWALYYQLKVQDRLRTPPKGHILVAFPNITREDAGIRELAQPTGETIYADDIDPAILRRRLQQAPGTSVEMVDEQLRRKRKVKKHDIFISYRREDSAWAAGRLSDLLVGEFGEHNVFFDTKSIKPGQDFREAIKERIKNSNILLAVMGRQWLTISHPDSGIRRIDDETDYVRWEIALALNEGLEVIPILIDGTSMPHKEYMPGLLEPLVYKNAYELSAKNFHREVRLLIKELQEILAEIEDAP